jgi:SAM-dependent methyltransferase
MPDSMFDIEQAVTERYTTGAQKRELGLCCPVDCDPQYLAAIPEEVLERDYGCGDPSRYVREGEVVLDLGSGTGKTCFIASQVVGPSGRVIGVDMNPDMLGLARRYCDEVGDRIGWHNVEFRHGRIQDLSPVIANGEIDVIVSNCVLNLVSDVEKARLFPEMFRVLKSGGRAVISDIVSDEVVPDSLKADPDLWSGCVSGAMTEAGMLEAFAEAGFHGIRILERAHRPWRTVKGIDFRSMTVEAFKIVVDHDRPAGPEPVDVTTVVKSPACEGPGCC